MKVLGVIPARYASVRFPGKPLAEINGKTMIMRVYGQAKKCGSLTDVVVATDDERILHHVRSFGGRAVMTSAEHGSGTERCNEACRLMNKDYDVVLNIQGDEPYIRPEQIGLVAGLFNDTETRIATLIKKITSQEELIDPNVVKALPGEGKRIIYFSRHPIPFLRGAEYDTWHDKYLFYKHIGLYGYRPEILRDIAALPSCQPEKAESLEQIRWLFHGYEIKAAITDVDSLSVDTPGDLSKFINMA